MGKFDTDHKHGRQLLGEWQIPYSKGTLEAVAYDEHGAIIARDQKSSFGDTARIVLTPDKTQMLANGQDLIFVEISAVDNNAIPVENGNNRVNINVHGAGRLIGLDNGDSTDYDQYKGNSRKLFSGKLLAIIAAKLEPGEIVVEVSSLGLPDEKLVLVSNPCERPSGLTAFMENGKSQLNEEIPVRKIELVSEQGNRLNNNQKSTTVHVKILPSNASYQDVEWRVTNESGIDTILAKVEPKGDSALVTALGDGRFYLRCMSKNGAENVRLISQMEFDVTGIGNALYNPYELVSGGLFTYSNRELGNGNERGVATPREGISYVGFSNLDFGDYGSDEITIPIFSLDDSKFSLQIWEGIPGEEGSEKLAQVIYQKESKWNVYQEETYQLSSRLRGVTSLTFVVERKIHIKGFYFTKREKAFAKLLANENDRIYGDNFTIAEEGIEEIGNNVSLEFYNMDFARQGFSKIIICGRSRIDKSTIHVRFHSEDGEVNQLVDFSYSDDFVIREFPLKSVQGKQKVTFVFLPGSNFDFKWFQFI